jgi:fructokinase
MGAGDATLATVLAALLTGVVPPHPEAWRPALRRAMRIAAATCRHPGGTLTLPSPALGWSTGSRSVVGPSYVGERPSPTS